MIATVTISLVSLALHDRQREATAPAADELTELGTLGPSSTQARRSITPSVALAPAARASSRTVGPQAQGDGSSDKMAYWSVQRRGANYGPSRLSAAELQAAADAGIEFLRLRLESFRPTARDFLIGSADHYQGINQADLRQLVEVLDEADRRGLKIVLAMFSLPGTRAKRDVADPSNGRIWRQ